MTRYSLILLGLVAIASCAKYPPEKFATAKEGLQYISEVKHGFLTDTSLNNGLEIKVQILPACLIQKTNEGSRQKYFSIQFSYKGRELLAQLSREDYGVFVQLFSFGMGQYIFLRTDSGKEYAASMVSYQPTYNMGRSNELIVIFSDDLSFHKNLNLVIKEFGLNVGELRFSIDVEKLHYSPYIEQF